ncbi:MAG: hypothetical protein KAI83_01345 [Thiomargarita sp.]|nr:hypothetical protein [Thiomargarita sp.]
METGESMATGFPAVVIKTSCPLVMVFVTTQGNHKGLPLQEYSYVE